MKKVVCLCLILIIALTGCNRSLSLMTEVELPNQNEEIRTFVDRVKDKNGIYLYSVVGKDEYFIVNYSVIQQGKQVKLFNGSRAEFREDVFTILMDEIEVKNTEGDHSNSHYLDNKQLGLHIYKLDKQQTTSIKVIKNGREIPIDRIGS
ncbi:hypothetical protein SAMN05216378_3521 [Paenibacillus catalpae]|uniref:Lipoprotein n=1 Tax=Paenibacillus catalpae TaxID=1045775 RepID=A0A1I2BGR8_9BACL|nr:hypothetical protein [Paenibacillus catalpae]SFE55402.1 hypothetical protein SAMN05216378_3521 [Paenibacillus catalpae]